MINGMDFDAICSRPQHSGRPTNPGTWPNVPVGKLFPPTREPLDDSNEINVPILTLNGRARPEAAGKIERVLAYMLQNLDKPLQMATLGALVGISMSNFYHLFKLATGCTPNDFLIRARMRRAGELLLKTDLSVKQLAALLGYDDPFYFSRVFKSVCGVPPREYRQRQPSRPNAAADGLATLTVEARPGRTVECPFAPLQSTKTNQAC